jgi:hypothetical protein
MAGRKDSTGQKADKKQKKQGKNGRGAQIRQAYKLARQHDKRIGWLLSGIFLGVTAIAVLLAVLVGPWYVWLLIGIPTALLATTTVFGRRAEAAAYASIEGRPGAAASALQALGRKWHTEAAVAVTKQQDLVHRAVGRAGIVLVGEGNPNRVKGLLAAETKRHQRVAMDVPVITLVVGDGEDQVPLRRLAKTIKKQDKALRPAEITEVMNRLRAMPSRPVPMPKGPLPKGVKLPKGAVPPR